MCWDRFHYLCRKCNLPDFSANDFSTFLSAVNAQKATDLYADKITEKSVAHEILTALQQTDDLALVERSVSVYARLNFGRSIDEPAQLKRVITYLVFLATVYMLVSSVYTVFVMPQFSNMYESLEVQPPGLFMWYVNYSSYMIAAIVILLLGVLLVAYQIRAMFSYKMPASDSLLYNGLVPETIRNSFLSIVEIIVYPVAVVFDGKWQKLGVISAHLQEVENAGLSLVTEMQSLLVIEVNKLNRKIERFIFFLMSFVSVIIVASIIVFLMSAYSPLFIMGEGL